MTSNTYTVRYNQENMLRIAKRFNNARRSYLLVNPLQAKHLPVSPGEALAMLGALGRRLAAAYPDCRLVIGFAETATAVGAVAADCLGGGCRYLTTTREELPEAAACLEFLEEHSHAAEQRLCLQGLAGWLAATDTVIFVDDELSTGRTLLNMIGQLKERLPELAVKRLVAASLLNRLSPADRARLAAAGVECCCLLSLPELEPEAAVAGLAVAEAGEAPGFAGGGDYGGEPGFACAPLPCAPLPDPRLGCSIRDYGAACRELAQGFAGYYAPKPGSGRVVVLGAEECMYPALVLGRLLEERGLAVGCHATTRSPIGICGEPGYPIRSGVKLASFYEPGRSAYVYNLEPCQALIVVSDSGCGDLRALGQLAAAWRSIEGVVGYESLYYVQAGSQGGVHVWYL